MARIPALLVVLGLATAITTAGLPLLRAGTPKPVKRSASAAAARDADIAFFEARVARDPIGALDRVRLGSLVLERGRITGAEGDLVRAEELARESLGLRRAHNASAWQLLAAALLGQHRFLEALDAAEQLVTMEPDAPGAASLRGEILLELGRYPAADSVFSGLGAVRNQLNVAPRYARWLELRGHSGAARRLLETTRAEVVGRGLPDDQLVWYDLRLGELAFKHGQLDEARRRLDAGLQIRPSDWRLLSARGRLALSQGNSHLAIALGDSALALHLDPAILAMLGDAWTARGDRSRAADYFRALEASAATAPPGGFHRSWYLALLDHDLQVKRILSRVTQDLELRQDVYGWDLLAWALHKNGRDAEAKGAMTLALRWGTDDPQILGHARAIMKTQ